MKARTNLFKSKQELVDNNPDILLTSNIKNLDNDDDEKTKKEK